MLAGASGQTPQRAMHTRPEPRLEHGNAVLEILDVLLDRAEVDLTESGALDRVRGVVDDVGHRYYKPLGSING